MYTLQLRITREMSLWSSRTGKWARVQLERCRHTRHLYGAQHRLLKAYLQPCCTWLYLVDHFINCTCSKSQFKQAPLSFLYNCSIPYRGLLGCACLFLWILFLLTGPPYKHVKLIYLPCLSKIKFGRHAFNGHTRCFPRITTWNRHGNPQYDKFWRFLKVIVS
jgi:hypothetical protein